MSPKNLIIVARYNEDIEWTKELDGDILIYNKGNDWPWEDIPKIDTENYGREGETFVRAIIEFYDQIDDYENVVFLQGNPQEHCKDFIQQINNLKSKNYTKLCDFFTIDKYPENYYIFNVHLSIISILLQVKDDNFKAYVEDRNPNKSERKPTYDNFFLLEETMGLCTILGIDYNNKTCEWANGAQYIIPSNYIKNKTLEWWKNLHQIFEYLSYHRKIESWSYALERIWPLIWEHSDS